MRTLISSKLFKLFLLFFITPLLLAACSQPQENSAELRLPVSINEVMASLINHSADPIWIAAWQEPQTDRDWRELEHLARQLQIGGSLLTIPGTGPVDKAWTDNEEWQGYSQQLSSAAARAVNAARSKDIELIGRAGDEIVTVCESCHIAFKPDLPTMNIYGELSPTASL
ncbi:MAG: hypothetical protein COA96_15345 [SAR86 cluster bacterium]|uniref:Uncharacterized protein n=1 Tax=SAR86 cluster bacterium TaxID=2030880 RepID=A0A2A5ARI8_9GAMM|nr:MAG: hypothetical protein COA96_15345 [SAR86 cluster bacterium]